MDGMSLQNLISKGWGTAARRTGATFTVFRPTTAMDPLDTTNRVIRLSARFVPGRGVGSGVGGYEGAFQQGVFDSLYTQPGDYLANATERFFIASQEKLQPVLCIKTGNVIRISRAANPLTDDTYSGFVACDATVVIDGWPTRLVTNSTKIAGSLPETHFGFWIAFLPVLPVAPQIADVVTDDLDRRFVVAAAQLSECGWRLAMRQLDG